MKECKNCKQNNCCFLALTCIPYNYKYHEMKELQTILGTDIPLTTRGILYLCNFDFRKLTITVFAEKLYESAWNALDAYANIPNPESQLVTGKTYDELITKLHKLHEDMKDPIWLENLSNQL